MKKITLFVYILTAIAFILISEGETNASINTLFSINVFFIISQTLLATSNSTKTNTNTDDTTSP